MRFPSSGDRDAWRTANRKHLEGYVDVESFHPSMVYYLDVTDHGQKILVRGLVHRDAFHEMVDVLASAATFGAMGRIDFETTEGEGHELICHGGKGAFRDVDEQGLAREIVDAIFEESERRADPQGSAPPDDAAKQLLARARALKVPNDPKDFVKLFDREFIALLRDVQGVRDRAIRREILEILGKLGAQVRAARKAARSGAAKAAAARRKTAAKTPTSTPKSRTASKSRKPPASKSRRTSASKSRSR